MQINVELNQLTIDMLASIPDPYPIYEKLREVGSVYWSEQMRVWLLADYHDVVAVGKDTKNFTAQPDWPHLFGEYAPELRQHTACMSKWLNFLDPPHHQPAQSLFLKAFYPDKVKARCQEIVPKLIDKLPKGKPIELIADFAMPLHIAAMNELINIPVEDYPQVIQWLQDLTMVSGYTENVRDMLLRGQKGMTEIMAYLLHLISDENPAFKGYLVEEALRRNHTRKVLSDVDICAQLVVMLTSGVVTIPQLIAVGVLLLHQNPDQLNKLRQEPRLMKSAVEEIMRYESPSQTFRRKAIADVEMGGKLIRNGDTVVALIGSANRDPELFPDPYRFDITRSPNKHLSLFAGPHSCVATPYVRVITSEALSALLEYAPNLSVPEQEIKWVPNNTIARGLERLYVTC